jgi:hypothetical protein
MTPRVIFLTAVSLLAPVLPAMANGLVYTKTSGKQCADESDPLLGKWTCPGPSGYSSEFLGEGNVASFGIRRPGERRAHSPFIWRGAGKVFGDLVEWRVDGGRPTFAVLRVWRAASDSEEDRTASELVVFRVTGTAPCKIAAIDARQPRANEIARNIMSQEDRPCEIATQLK